MRRLSAALGGLAGAREVVPELERRLQTVGDQVLLHIPARPGGCGCPPAGPGPNYSPAMARRSSCSDWIRCRSPLTPPG